MLAKKETRELGKIIVCGFGTFFMMSITTMAASRTCVPCILSLTIVLVIMFIDMISELNSRFFSCAFAITVAIACTVGYVCSYVQYRDESNFCREVYEELKSAKDTGVIHSNWDRTLAMRKTLYRNKTLTDVYPLMYYQEKYEIPNNVKYFISSEKYTVYNLSCDGLYSQYPAIELNNEIYVPLSFPHLEELITQEFNVVRYYNYQNAFVGIGMNDKKIDCNESEVLQIGNLFFVKLDYVIEQWDYSYYFDANENTLVFTSIKEN